MKPTACIDRGNMVPGVPIALLAAAVAASLALTARPGHAHAPVSAPAKTEVSAGLSLTWRSQGVVDDGLPWRIPGALMGGHALPAQEGLELDDAFLGIRHPLSDRLHVGAKIAAHGHGGDSGDVDIELEHAFVGFSHELAHQPVLFEAGRMSPRFSPAVAEHPSTRLFSEAPLAMDVFLGRHYHDEGILLMRSDPDGLSAGVELWRGSNFPATSGSGGGAWDLFATYRWSGHRQQADVGLWHLHADARLRPDARYQEGHSHGLPDEEMPPDIRFTGDTRLTGLHGSVRHFVRPDLAIGISGEFLDSRSDGALSDALRRANYTGDYRGGWIQPELHWGRHTLGLRYERLELKNELHGAAAPGLAKDANLLNDDDPERLGIAWRYRFDHGLAVRVEWTRDQSLPERSNRLGIGLVWQQTRPLRGL
ncbi:hypothetical protein [Thioalkalivibrio paradoxus]|uniref:Porin n=1 Tax=Thioalkalivibrio paradoxus ARh 1 TaxID=713585 RepID=W0DQB1_9GAMM|nr:hypothetical protein [Thioalkalivibrio paradoxus]AHE99065.1 hypothetical protein THITH_13245 [Thioalkalivibrio paradoxus ARh 1]